MVVCIDGHRMITTDKLWSYGAAFNKLGLGTGHEQGLERNNRVEVSHLSVRRQEHEIQGFISPRSAQRFASVHSALYNTFNLQRYLISRHTLRTLRAEAMQQ